MALLTHDKRIISFLDSSKECEGEVYRCIVRTADTEESVVETYYYCSLYSNKTTLVNRVQSTAVVESLYRLLASGEYAHRYLLALELANCLWAAERVLLERNVDHLVLPDRSNLLQLSNYDRPVMALVIDHVKAVIHEAWKVVGNGSPIANRRLSPAELHKLVETYLGNHEAALKSNYLNLRTRWPRMFKTSVNRENELEQMLKGVSMIECIRRSLMTLDSKHIAPVQWVNRHLGASNYNHVGEASAEHYNDPHSRVPEGDLNGPWFLHSAWHATAHPDSFWRNNLGINGKQFPPISKPSLVQAKAGSFTFIRLRVRIQIEIRMGQAGFHVVNFQGREVADTRANQFWVKPGDICKLWDNFEKDWNLFQDVERGKVYERKLLYSVMIRDLIGPHPFLDCSCLSFSEHANMEPFAMPLRNIVFLSIFTESKLLAETMSGSDLASMSLNPRTLCLEVYRTPDNDFIKY